MKGTWPGDAITTIETVDGKKWLTKEFLITTSNDAVNFVFSVGTGTPQTVDIENIKTTTFINISSKVNVVTTNIENIVSKHTANPNTYYYTISGQRITKPTQSGIYIHNGKKVLIK